MILSNTKTKLTLVTTEYNCINSTLPSIALESIWSDQTNFLLKGITHFSREGIAFQLSIYSVKLPLCVFLLIKLNKTESFGNSAIIQSNLKKKAKG